MPCRFRVLRSKTQSLIKNKVRYKESRRRKRRGRRI
jgi:hypothetical protein